MDKIEKIRQKIDRMLDDICDADGFVQKKDEPRYDALVEVLDFLDTLSEEPDKSLEEEISRTYHDGSVTDTEDIDHVAYENIARHFAEWGAEHSPLPEDTVIFNKGIEEGKRLMMEEWLKDRDGCFWDGVNEGKKAMEEQMMKEAVEGEITKDNRGNNVVRACVFNKDFEYGDKVRIIVLPKEDQANG